MKLKTLYRPSGTKLEVNEYMFDLFKKGDASLKDFSDRKPESAEQKEKAKLELKEKREIEASIKKEYQIDVDLRKYGGSEGLAKLKEYYEELKNGDTNS